MIVRGDAALLKRLREIAKTWPPFEREIFEFYLWIAYHWRISLCFPDALQGRSTLTCVLFSTASGKRSSRKC